MENKKAATSLKKRSNKLFFFFCVSVVNLYRESAGVSRTQKWYRLLTQKVMSLYEYKEYRRAICAV